MSEKESRKRRPKEMTSFMRVAIIRMVPEKQKVFIMRLLKEFGVWQIECLYGYI